MKRKTTAYWLRKAKWHAFLWRRLRRAAYLRTANYKPLVPVVLVVREDGVQWFAFECEHCGGYHTHGAGERGENPARYVSSRTSHCPDTYSDGYLLDWSGQIVTQANTAYDNPDLSPGELEERQQAERENIRIALQVERAANPTPRGPTLAELQLENYIRNEEHRQRPEEN